MPRTASGSSVSGGSVFSGRSQGVSVSGVRYVNSSQVQPCLFSGPDGVRQHSKRNLDGGYVGTGAIPPEQTGALDYISRAAPTATFPKARHDRPGEVGWATKYLGVTRGL